LLNYRPHASPSRFVREGDGGPARVLG
jgi:hypothetical protein